MQKTSVQEALAGFNQVIGKLLPDVSSLSNEQLAVIFHRYERLVGPYFIGMMAIVRGRCKSPEALEACTENLLCEVNEDHQMMLRQFTAQIDSYLSQEAVQIALSGGDSVGDAAVSSLLNRVAFTPTSLPGLWIMGGLETASQVFIPWMEQAAVPLGMANTEYLIKHGIADIAHADEFARAIMAEEALLGESLVQGRPEEQEGLAQVYEYLRFIFTPPVIG